MSGEQRPKGQSGFSLTELVMSLAITSFLLLALLSLYAQGQTIGSQVEGTLKVQGNVRVAMDRITRDLRMAGFAVPTGQRLGGTETWMPAVFFATPTGVAFRADLDGSQAQIACTPKSSNTNCPLTKLVLDSVNYYAGLSCAAADGTVGGTKLVTTREGRNWEALTCSAVSTADRTLTVNSMTNGAMAAGRSHVATVEQVYYRYTARAGSPYGALSRAVAYGHLPDNTIPPVGLTWTVIADHLSVFQLDYRNAAGTSFTSFPLSAADRADIAQVSVVLEGFDQIGPDGQPQEVQVRSQVLLRNPL